MVYLMIYSSKTNLKKPSIIAKCRGILSLEFKRGHWVDRATLGIIKRIVIASYNRKV
jgi:hypothetical protein